MNQNYQQTALLEAKKSEFIRHFILIYDFQPFFFRSGTGKTPDLCEGCWAGEVVTFFVIHLFFISLIFSTLAEMNFYDHQYLEKKPFDSSQWKDDDDNYFKIPPLWQIKN